MKRALFPIGALIFVIGLIYAAWFAAYLPKAPEPAEGEEAAPLVGLDRVGAWGSDVGTRFGGGIAFMIIGGLMARAGRKSSGNAKADSPGYRDNAAEAESDYVTTLSEIVAKLDAVLESDASAEDVEKRSQPIGEQLAIILEEQVPDFLDSRQAMIDDLGLERFAGMIGHFASMERAAARAWSALTDEAWHEVPPSIERAQRGGKQALDELRSAAKAA